MKRNLLLTIITVFGFTAAFSQFSHKDYGEGLAIPINSDYQMDIDNDGSVDFYINQYPGEIGFSPIYSVGCFASYSESSYTTFGARELQVFEQGDHIQITGPNLYDYIDDDRGSIYSESGGLDQAWTNLEDQFIGFAVFHQGGGVSNGWMRIAIDENEKTLILKEMAYRRSASMEDSYISAGEGSVVAVKNLDDLNEVVISPNPVRDLIQINFDYTGTEKLQITILDNTGKLVDKQFANGSSNHSFDASSWAPGMYFVNFSTNNGVRSEKIFVTK